jgi:hypothetical protein
MFYQYGTPGNEKQATEAEESLFWAKQLETYLQPYSERLDAYVDRRVVGNVTATIGSIVRTRSELTLTEVGSALCGPEHTDAGVGRLQRVLQHQGWEAQLIEEVLWEQAEESRKAMEQRGETPLCIWDSSVLEKPESVRMEGLGAVRSSRARRLARSRGGVFNQVGKPIRVRGYEWESLLLLGASGVPQVVSMRWWGRQKGVAGQQRRIQEALLSQAAQRWGDRVRHVFDRGYGHGPWLWQRLRATGCALWCGSPERQPAHRCLWAAAQSLGDRARQAALGRGTTALGYPFPRASQHAGARLAGTTPRVWGSVVVGGGATRQRARTLVSAHQ